MIETKMAEISHLEHDLYQKLKISRGVSAINFAEIRKLFSIDILQKLITHRQTHRHYRVHYQPPLYGWQ